MLASMALMLLAIGVIWTHGRMHERGIWQARVDALTAERDRAAARIDGLTEALTRARAQRDRDAADAEDAARADEGADRVALPPAAADRVLGR